MFNNLENENLVRTLKEEKKIQPLLCRLGWHRWANWEFDKGILEKYIDPHDFNTRLPANTMHTRCTRCEMPRMEFIYSSTIYKRNKNK